MTAATRRGARLRGLGWAAAALIAVWLLSLTLVERRQPGSINLAPFSRKAPALRCLLGDCSSPRNRNEAAVFLLVDLVGNVVVFVPLGAALAVATFPRRSRGKRRFGLRWWGGILLAGCLFSLGIEIAQLFMETRATDVDDVILNTLGTLIGATLVRLLSVFL